MLIFIEQSPKQSAKGKKAGNKSKSPEKSQSPKGKRQKSLSPKGGKRKPVTPVQPDPSTLSQEVAVKETDSTPQPGKVGYVYVNERIDPKLIKILCDHWDVVEIGFINGVKFVFRKIRKEREQIIRYLFEIKKNFFEFLTRPDTKQIETENFVKVYKLL